MNLWIEAERAVRAAICRSGGIMAKDIARLLSLSRKDVNRILYTSLLLKELCWQDSDYRWHGIMRQARLHSGLIPWFFAIADRRRYKRNLRYAKRSPCAAYRTDISEKKREATDLNRLFPALDIVLFKT